MYVWRLERDNEGAWQSNLINDALYGEGSTFDKKHRCHPGNMPNPFEERERGTELYHKFNCGDHLDYYFGFKTLKQYKSAFKSKHLRRDLEKFRGRLKRYKVDRKDVVLGNHQVAFIKSKAVLISERSPNIA